MGNYVKNTSNEISGVEQPQNLKDFANFVGDATIEDLKQEVILRGLCERVRTYTILQGMIQGAKQKISSDMLIDVILDYLASSRIIFKREIIRIASDWDGTLVDYFAILEIAVERIVALHTKSEPFNVNSSPIDFDPTLDKMLAQRLIEQTKARQLLNNLICAVCKGEPTDELIQEVKQNIPCDMLFEVIIGVVADLKLQERNVVPENDEGTRDGVGRTRR